MQNSIKLTGALLASVLLTGAAQAEIALAPGLNITGYAAGSVGYDRLDFDAGDDADEARMDLDAIRLDALFNYNNTVSAKLSLYSLAGDELVVPEAFVSYKTGDVTVTAGRFLTWAGYESFDIPAAGAITSGDVFGLLPKHHNGVKVAWSLDNFTVGAALLDSVWGYTYYKGDGDINHGSLGAELYAAYDDKTFSFAATIAYEHDHVLMDADAVNINVWGQYYIDSSKTTLGAELTYQRSENKLGHGDAFSALLFARQALGEKWTLAGRVSAGTADAGIGSVGLDDTDFVKLSVIPAVALSENLEMRAEVSYGAYDDYYDLDGLAPRELKNEVFAGVQVIFKF